MREGQTCTLSCYENNSKLQNLQRQEAGGKHLWNLSEQVPYMTGHHEAKANGCQRHCSYRCGVAQHDEDTPGMDRRGTKPMK